LSQLPKAKDISTPTGFIAETGLSSIGAKSNQSSRFSNEILKQIDNNLGPERDDEYANLIKEETIEEQRASLMNQ